MAKSDKAVSVADEVIMNKIYLIREKKVMLDEDLALLYEVETKQLKRQVKRNIDRFPEDFMFSLNRKELESLRSQIGTSNWGGNRYLPMAFTEQGVAMLSSVLNSGRAIQVNIQIIRIFTRMREMLLMHKDILVKLEELEKGILKQSARLDKHGQQIAIIFEVLKKLLNPPTPPPPTPLPPRSRIGFKKEG